MHNKIKLPDRIFTYLINSKLFIMETKAIKKNEVKFSKKQVKQIYEIVFFVIAEENKNLATKHEIYKIQSRLLYKLISLLILFQGVFLFVMKLIAF